jgi:heat shock protein HslJ
VSAHRGRPVRTRASLLALIASVIAIPLALSGCVASGPSTPDLRLDGTWHLASGSDKGFGLPIGGHSITLTIGDAAHTGGDEPCSSYRATVTGGIGPVFVTAARTAGTRDDCATTALAHLEQSYLSALAASRFAALQQGILVLSSPESDLVFLRSVPGIVANIQNTSWQLFSVGADVPSIAGAPRTDPVLLRFIGTDDFKLSSPCMSMAGGYQIEGDNLEMGQPAEVGQWCPKADRDLTLATMPEFSAPLLIDVSTPGNGAPPVLVLTNLDDNLTVVFRAVA